MAGESTNKPQGPGSNPGIPPINDQGAAKPNPAPAPPSSLPGKDPAEAMEKLRKENEKGYKALGDFLKAQEKVKKALEDHAKAIEDAEKANVAFGDAMAAAKKAGLDHTKTTKEIDERYEEYRDRITGEWKEGTEAARALYEAEHKSANSLLEAAKEEEKLASEEAVKKRLALEIADKERLSTEKDIEVMKGLRETVLSVDKSLESELGAVDELGKAFQSSVTAIEKYNTSLDALPKKLSAVNAEIRMYEMQEALKDEKKVFQLKEADRKADRVAAREAIRIEREERLKAQDEQMLEAMKQKGGIAGAVDIKKSLDDFVAAEKEKIKRLKPEASEKYIANQVQAALSSRGKAFAEKEMIEKFSQERSEAEKKFIEKVMEDKKVSRETAQAIVFEMKSSKSSEIYKELKEINERESQQLASLKNLDENQIQVLQRADLERSEQLQARAEGASRDPAKGLEKLGIRLGIKLDALKSGLSEIFGQNSGWIKKILLVLTLVIGATLGYIWYKMKMVAGFLSYIPGLGKVFGKIGGAFGGIGSKIGSLFSPIQKVLGPILKFFPSLTGSLGAFSKAFGFGFRILGKFFFYITLAIDLVMGAVKGFQRLGNIEGVLMGAVAGLVNWLTFGFLDFDDIFDFMKNNLMPLFEGIAFTLKNAWQLVTEIFSSIVKSWKKVFEIFGSDMTIGEKISELIKVVIRNIASMIGISIRFIGRQIMGMFGKLFSSSGNESILQVIMGWISDGLPKLWQIMKDAFISLWEYVSSGEFMEDIANAVMGVDFGDDAEVERKATKAAEEARDRQIKENPADFITAELTYRMTLKEVAEQELQFKKHNEEQAKKRAGISARLVDLPQTTTTTQTAMAHGAKEVATATTSAQMARMAASKPNATTTAINAPTTNVMSGGGGEPTVLMAPVSRNNDPTFRSFSYGESPAM